MLICPLKNRCKQNEVAFPASTSLVPAIYPFSLPKMSTVSTATAVGPVAIGDVPLLPRKRKREDDRADNHRDVQPKVTCGYADCGRVFTQGELYGSALNGHIRTHFNPSRVCGWKVINKITGRLEDCGSRCSYPTSFVKHVRSCHLHLGKVVCPNCNELWRDNADMRRHLRCCQAGSSAPKRRRKKNA